MTLVFKGRFALASLDEKLSSYLPASGGFFIEIGGNDGISQSNTKRLELFFGWRGILVEPDPRNFRRMQLSRSRETSKFEGACVPFDYELDVVEMKYSNLMTVSSSLRPDLEDEREHLAQGEKWLSPFDSQRTFNARALRLNDLLYLAGAPEIVDFFSLDVEGAELSVLGGIDFGSYSFSNLLVETRSIAKIQEFLSSRGYKLVDKLTSHDYLFQKSNR